MSGEESPDLSPAMNRAAIPEQVDPAAEVTQEVTEEHLDIETCEVVGPTPEVERHAPALRRHREPAANREPIVAVPVTDAWRLASGRPGPADIRDEEKPAFIDEHEMGAARRFFIRGQSCCIHRAMATSSRSTARRSGFWQLHPNAVSTFQTCAV